MWSARRRGGGVDEMDFLYAWAPFPGPRGLRIQINAAALRLYRKLASVDVQALDISDYSKRYLDGYRQNLRGTLQLVSHLLGLALKNGADTGDILLIDYGGGTGLLALLAREAGVGTVVYNDIYDVSCRDAEVIGESIGNRADHYVHGDIDEVVQFLERSGLCCDAITSYDVIEHVYDVDYFFATIGRLPSRALTVVMASSANASNPRRLQDLTKLHLDVEHRDRAKVWGHKERDAAKAFLSIRREIVADQLERRGRPCDTDVVEELARRTRGSIEPAIRQRVDEFLAYDQLPPPPGHPTNTCDPYTGNWAEHLVEPDRLGRILKAAGMRTQILAGYYGSESGRRRLVTVPLNAVIAALGRRALSVAPYYIVFGQSPTPSRQRQGLPAS
jgi:2-polyprenyl-3-methyl-5-hydroxy-6-metoxy-1,4-benzoquinol methylase